jgi:general secretion pathway protein G
MKQILRGLLCALLTFVISFGLIKALSLPFARQEALEIVLRQDLYAMRKAINQYASDQERQPPSLNDLVNQGYIREIPLDPVTTRQDWEVEFVELKGVYSVDGIVDIHSSSSEVSIFGIPYYKF